MRTWLNRHFLLLTVFITGASVLIIEVAALRVLSPHFGNTIFTASSVISVILAALSIGYYVGGRLSDKHPKEALFYTIITFSGFAVVIFHLLGLLLLPLMSGAFSMVTGPLVSAVSLFLLPAVLLGTLSPYAIKLQSQRAPEAGLGHVAGSVFFWSTLGSITGSLAAGFVLIPHFGLNQIIIATGVTLFLLGLLPLTRLGLSKEKWQDALFVFALLAGGTLLLGSMTAEGVVYTHDGVYEKITIVDGTFKGRQKRIFEQDRSSSGAMYLDSDDPTDMVVDYTRYYALYKVFAPRMKNALVIGGGAYAIPKALLAELPGVEVDVAEIEPGLFDLAQKYFRVPNDARLHNVVADGRRLLHDRDKRYDFIFSDVYYSLFSVPAHFTTREFFETAKSRLSDDGVFIASMVGDLSRRKPSLIFSEIRTFQSAFPNSYFFTVKSPKRIDTQNIVLVGMNSDRHIDVSAPQFATSDNPVIAGLAARQLDLSRYDLASNSILTDNYAPVEYMTGKMFQRSVDGPVLASCSDHSRPLSGKEMAALITQQRGYDAKARRTFLQAEMGALAGTVTSQIWTDKDGKKRENIIARFEPEKERRVVLAARYDAAPSATALLAELGRVISTLDLPPRSGIDIAFLDKGGAAYFTGHLDEFYNGKNPWTGIALGNVCSKNLHLSREQTSREAAPEQLAHFWMIAQGIDKDLFTDAETGTVKAIHTALNDAGIPTFLLDDESAAKTNTCNPADMENTARAIIDYLYKIH